MGFAFSRIWLELCIELVFYFGWDSYVLSSLGVLLCEFDIKAQNYKESNVNACFLLW